jgi:hypothetical protein
MAASEADGAEVAGGPVGLGGAAMADAAAGVDAGAVWQPVARSTAARMAAEIARVRPAAWCTGDLRALPDDPCATARPTIDPCTSTP